MAISMHDLATHGRRNRLGCACPRRLARVALRELDLAAAHVSFPTDLTFRAHVGCTTDVTFLTDVKTRAHVGGPADVPF